MSTAPLRLPSPPHTLAKVIQAASDPSVPVTTLARVVASDPGLSVQLLRMVNSSLYRRGSRIATVDRAVAILGNRSLRNLAMCVAVQNCVKGTITGFDLDRFWEDSLRRAVAARLLAERACDPSIDPMEAFTFALLQDLGVLALVQTHPDKAAAWSAAANRLAEDRRTGEQALFGVAHDGIADDLIHAWSLPDELAMPMRHHHLPVRAPVEHRLRCEIAGQAELLAQVLSAQDKRAALGAARAGLRRGAAIEAEAVDALIAELASKVEDIARELGFRVGTQPTIETILQAANAGLVEMNLSYEDLVRKLEQALAEKDALAKELATRNKELAQLSLTDALTGLPNRRALSGRLSFEVSRIATEPGNVGFVIGDIDKFKAVNDTWGHEFGDVVLKAIGKALCDAAGTDVLVSRLGGEEFGVVVPMADAAGTIAESLRRAVEATTLRCPDGVMRNFTISMGVARVEGPAPAGHDAEAASVALYRAADRALYEAKQAGRNCVRVSTTVVPWPSATDRAA
jgi:diguanylate cyclase (GGDEF)-like protein